MYSKGLCSKNVNSIVKQNFKYILKSFIKLVYCFKTVLITLIRILVFLLLVCFDTGSLYIAQLSWNMLCRPGYP